MTEEERKLRHIGALEELCAEAADYMESIGFGSETNAEELHGALLCAAGGHVMDKLSPGQRLKKDARVLAEWALADLYDTIPRPVVSVPDIIQAARRVLGEE